VTFVETSYEMLTAVAELMNLTYWDRVWILQEASTPKDSDLSDDSNHSTWVCCGSMTISWKAFAEANRRLIRAAWENEVRQHVDLHDVANTNIATVKYLEELRYAKTLQHPLYPMLVRTRTSDATDPRDKLYAILGLVDERDDPRLRPDYTLTVEEVYTKLAMTIITRSQSLDCLGSAGLVRDHDVPSWVADWTVQHDRTPQPFYQTGQRRRDDGVGEQGGNIFNASKDITPQIVFSKIGKRLVARGFCLDKIEKVSMPRQRPDEDLNKVWQGWTGIANPDNSAYKSGGSKLQAFEKVLRADYNAVRGDWSAERGASIKEFTDSEVNIFKLHDGIVDAMTWHRRVFVTSKGYMGIGPGTIVPNAAVCVLFGSQMPVILHEEGDH
jgi:hypothetical protein